MFDHAGLAIGLSNLMVLVTGLAIWWMERKRRIMWQKHAGYLKTMCEFWRNSSTNELDVERHLLPWEGDGDD